MLIDALKKFGLTYKEAKTYLALLNTGTAVVSDVAKQSGINRSTSYVLLETLIKKGLAGASTENKVRRYSAAPPSKIAHQLKDSIDEKNKLLLIANTVLPELKSYYNESYTTGNARPRIRLYDGLEGIKRVFDDTLTAHKTVYTYSSLENVEGVLQENYQEHLQMHSQRGIQRRFIMPDRQRVKEVVSLFPQILQDTRLINSNQFPLSPEINVYNNKISFLLCKERFAVIIESSELADAFRKIFDLSWVGAKKITKNTEHKKEAVPSDALAM